MKHFRTSFSEIICGNIKIPASLRVGLISDSSNVDYPLIHNRSVQLGSGSSFTTASSKITKNIVVDKYVIYCDQESGTCGPWIVENSIQVKIYETENNTLLAQKTIGRLDDISIMPSDGVYEHPSIILEPCSPSINLKDVSLRIEFNSLCDSGSNVCCDHLPENVSVSGYDVLCLPLTDFYVVPPDPTTTTTPAPVVVNRTIIDRQPTIKTSDDIDYYRVESDISIIGGSSFTYWWERKEEGTDWVRHTDLQESLSNKTVFIREPKEKDYYYRLLLIEPNKIYSDSIFFDFPDPTTTTTTTLAPKYFEPPNAVTNVESSGGFRKVFLSWEPPVYDGNSDITGYHIVGKLPDGGKFWDDETTIVNTGVEPSVTSYFQPVSFEYDGVNIQYSVFSKNYFGIKGSSASVLGHNSVFGKTISNDPPTVLNFSLFPFRTSSSRGYNLDWETISSPDQPLLSHVIKYRPSGSIEDYVTDIYSDVETSVSITGSFLGCEPYEVTVEGINEVGNSIPVTGYSLMAFPPSAPTGVSYTLLDGQSNSFVEMSGSWNSPLDDGFCPVNDYVFSYRLLPDGDFTDPITTNNLLSFKTSDTLPSGDYELRVAGISEFRRATSWDSDGNVVELHRIYNTGVYGFYNPLTVFIYNFESWRVINENPNSDYSREETYPYWPSGFIITEDVGPRNLPARLNCGNRNLQKDDGSFYDCYDGFETRKFGNSGLYLSEDNFACPTDTYREGSDGEYTNAWKWLEGPVINDQGARTPSFWGLDPIPLHKNEKSKVTFEFWFKLSGAYLSSWEEDPTYVADISFLHTKDISTLHDAFTSSNGFDYMYDGVSNYSNHYSIMNDYDNFYERYAFSNFGIKGQYVPSLGFRLIYNDKHAMREVKYIDPTAPTDAFPREIATILTQASSNLTNLAYPETVNEFTGRFSSHGVNLNNGDIPTNVYIDDTDWHHIALCLDGEASNFVTMYYDGVEVFTHKPTIHLHTEHDGTNLQLFHSYKTTPGVEYTYLGSDYDPLLAYGRFNLGVKIGIEDYDSIENYDDTSQCLHYDDVRLSASVIYDGAFDPPTSPHT
tara:strand:+ start:18768 stop:21962 length:3195 start_codon:yes stop_codon:yes gene_type:complete